MQRSKYGSLTREVLRAIAGGKFLLREHEKDYSIKQIIRRLERQKMIKLCERNGKQIMEITKDGRTKIKRYDFDELTIKEPRRWDGLYRVVSFDIPEKNRVARGALQSKLNKLGFYPFQRSVYVYPYDCQDEIDFISEFFEVRRFVNFMLVKEIWGEHRIEQYFGLN